MDVKLPTIKIPPKLVKSIFLASSGLFAGMGASINTVAVPAILASADPLPAWRTLYNRGKNTAFLTFPVTITTALYMFYKKGDLRYLTCIGLTVLVPLYTLKFMLPTNNALFELKGTNPEESRKQAKQLITTWSGLQWIRTALGIGVFAIGVNAVVYK